MFALHEPRGEDTRPRTVSYSCIPCITASEYLRSVDWTYLFMFCHSCAVELQLDEEAQQQSSGAAASDQAYSHRRRCDPQVACPGRSHARLQARTVAWLFVAGLSSCAVVVSFLGQWYHHLFGQSDVGLLCWHLIRSEDVGFVFIILCGWLWPTQLRWASCCSLRWPGRIFCGCPRAESAHEAVSADAGPPEE